MRWTFAFLLLAGCTTAETPQEACRRQSYKDPTVKQMIMQQAGSPYLFNNQQTALHQAEHTAMLHCLQARGLAAPGGVEPMHVQQTHSLF